MNGRPLFVAPNFGQTVTIDKCAFTNNRTSTTAAALYLTGSGTMTVSGCTFSGNTSVGNGGAVLISQASGTARVADCVFEDNLSQSSGGSIYVNEAGVTAIVRCTMRGGFATYGSAMFINGSSSALDLVNCVIDDNTAGVSGGIYLAGSSPRVTNCLFTNSKASSVGGSVFATSNSDPTFSNCTFAQGRAFNGACSFAFDSLSKPLYRNCVVWNNTNTNGVDVFGGPGGANLSNCLVEGGYGGSLDQDPLFRNPAEGDFRLLPWSPAVESGSNAVIATDALDLDGDGNTAELIPFDLDLSVRVFDGDENGTGTVDIGCYEFHDDWTKAGPIGDIDGDGDVDGADLGALLATWGPCSSCLADLNHDGTVNGADLGALLTNWG